MNERWQMRPHHGLCLTYFAGKGYSSDFVQNMAAVCAELKENPDREIILQSETDLLCKACPHNLDGLCETEQKVAGYDAKCLALCGLRNGAVLQWREFRQMVVQKILLPGLLGEICADCRWSNICQQSTVENSVQSVENLLKIPAVQ